MSKTIEAPEVDTLNLTDITVEKDFNPRGEIDKASIADLAKSIKQEGILQPVLVRKDEDGGYRLVAGHRRIMAAKQAGITQVPVLVRDNMDDETARALAFDENEQREDMSPMARAVALNHQFKKLGSYKKVAESRAINAQQVAALVKMCDLPESVQKIALKHKAFGPDLAKTLNEVAAVPGGEPVAEFLANQAMSDPAIYRKIRDDLDRMLNQIDQYRTRAETEEERQSVPFVCAFNEIEPIELFDPEKAAELTARGIAARRAFPDWGGRSTGLRILRAESWQEGEPGIGVSMSEESHDRIVASKSGLVIEVDEWRSSVFVFDIEVVKAEVEQTIETAERAAKAELKRLEEQAKTNAKEAGATLAEGEDPVQAQRRAEREQAKKDAAVARANNEAIGQKLLKRGTRPLNKKDQLETIRLMAKVMARQADTLAAQGMRLCFTAWKEVEVKELKSGETREKITYLEPREAEDRLQEALDNAKSTDEVLRIITDALVTATYVDQREIPQSKRVNSYTTEPIRRVPRSDMAVVDRLAKGVLPDDVETIREKSVKEGYDTTFFRYSPES